MGTNRKKKIEKGSKLGFYISDDVPKTILTKLNKPGLNLNKLLVKALIEYFEKEELQKKSKTKQERFTKIEDIELPKNDLTIHKEEVIIHPTKSKKEKLPPPLEIDSNETNDTSIDDLDIPDWLL